MIAAATADVDEDEEVNFILLFVGVKIDEKIKAKGQSSRKR